MDRQKRAEELEIQILKYARNELLVAFRFLDLALCKPEYQTRNIETLGIDGKYFRFSSDFIFELYKQGGGELTAERLYKCFMDKPPSPGGYQRLHGLFRRDEHGLWYEPPEQKENTLLTAAGQGVLSGSITVGISVDEVANGAADGSLQDEWQAISERIQVDLETASQLSWGDRAANLLQNVQEVNREKYDYSGFLRKFAVLGENMQINDDEFDYIFYTYGLQLYENTPLIESLEYKGLIYFTDGYGTFPEKKPAYETAFVFIDDEYGQPEVPVWAIKLVLRQDEI